MNCSLGLEYRDLTIGEATSEMFAGLRRTGEQALREKNFLGSKKKND